MTDSDTNKSNETIEETASAPEVEAEFIAADKAPASIGNRILAVLIDGLICMALSVVPVLGALAAIGYMLTRDALPFLDGQSVGKKAMKLRAVSSETNAPLTNNWGASVVRNVVLYIPFFAIVELIVLSNNKDNQRLGDQWAKTKVVVEG
ncbi:MAG: RDD family protein [Kiritimatiellia bacterium]